MPASQPARIAVLGFSRFEREAFQSTLRLGAAEGGGYIGESSLDGADFVIADGQDGRVIAALERKGLLERTVAIGGPPRPGVLLQLERPINPPHVLGALDGLPRRARDAATGRVVSPHVERVLEALAERTMTFPLDIDVHAPAPHARQGSAASVTAGADFGGRRSPRAQAADAGSVARSSAAVSANTAPASLWLDDLDPAGPPHAATHADKHTDPFGEHDTHPAHGGDPFDGPGGATTHVLVVDPDPSALRPLVAGLRRAGFELHFARSARDAVWRLERRAFGAVLVAGAMPPLPDGSELCQALKALAAPADGARPVMALLLDADEARTARHPGLAVVDGWLRQPFDAVDLLSFLGERMASRTRAHAADRLGTLG